LKKWIEPEIQNLALKDTKGGPKYDPKVDGDAIYDENSNKWWQAIGKS
jgi:hypothetical protein